MNITEMKQALRDAEQTMRAADHLAYTLAQMLVGRLKHVNSPYLLGQLKKELSHYNRHTGRWSE